MTGYLVDGTDEHDHERARELAAARPDGFLTAEEDAWLEAHLLLCAACSAVAADYASQRSLFGPARAAMPQAPRDLWARTAAAIDADRRSAAPARRAARRRGLAWVYAPLAGVMVVAVVVGASLLNGIPATPSTTKGEEPDATPFQLAADDVQVIARGEDGRLELRRQAVAEVCPTDAQSCGLLPTPQTMSTNVLAAAGAWDAIISPDEAQVVVVEKGDGAQGVYVFSVGSPAPVESAAPSIAAAPSDSPAIATAAPTEAPSVAPSASAPATSAAPSDPASSAAPASATPSEPASATAGPASSAPAASDDGSPAPASETPSEPASVEPSASVEASAEPQPTPSVEVTPLPDGAVQIASNVIVVGNAAAYSPDGTRFAFSARPADGATGPDVYVWHVGDARAKAITDDHASVFAAWHGDDLLVSRVVDGTPETIERSPSDATPTTLVKGAWMPVVGPEGRTAAWWDGTVGATAGGGWAPGRGSLVVGGWPAADGGSAQVLADDGLTDWQVAWDPSGRLFAAWTTTAAPGKPGTLSLYRVNDDGRIDLANPKLDKAPAYAGFSIREGRLTWSAPADGGDRTVQVLAWKGDQFGRFEILTEDGTTVVR